MTIVKPIIRSIIRSQAVESGTTSTPIGRAYNFQGTDDVVDLGSGVLSDSDFTIAFWAKHDLSANRYPYGGGNASNTNGTGLLSYILTNGTWANLINNGSGTAVTISRSGVVANTWTFHAISFDRDGNAITYLGTEAAAVTAGTPVSVSGKVGSVAISNFYLGKYGIVAAYNTGLMSSFYVYNSVLSESELNQLRTANTVTGKSPHRFFKCHDQHATIATDSSSNAANGTKSGINAAVGQFHYEGSDVPIKYVA